MEEDIKTNWGTGPWGWGHIIYCNNGCLVCILPIKVKSKGYIPRALSKRDKAIAIARVNLHDCLQKKE